MPPSSSPPIPHPPIRLVRALAMQPLIRLGGFVGTILVAAGCAGAADPTLDAPAAPAPSPPPAAPAEAAAPAGEPVSLCVLEDGRIAMVEGVVHPETGDTLIGGRPWREVHREGEPPYAAGVEWYIRNDMIHVPGRDLPLTKYGLTRILGPKEVVPYGKYRGVPLFVEEGQQDGVADIVYVFVRPGCEFQTYLQEYSLGAVRG